MREKRGRKREREEEEEREGERMSDFGSSQSVDFPSDCSPRHE